MEHGAEVVRVANDDDHVVGIVLDLKRITFWDMGKRGCATYGRNGVVWVEKSKTPKQELNCEIWGKGGVRHMGEMGLSGWRNQRLQKQELNCEIWGKGVCDIWEKW